MSVEKLIAESVRILHQAVNEAVTTPGWYVVDNKERPVKGPLKEKEANELASKMSIGGKEFSAEYFSDYEIRRASER